MKTAQESVAKWIERASVSGDEYLKGARSPKRSQSGAAIAAKGIMVSEFNAAANRGAIEAGLRRSGDAGWFAGVEQKGVQNFTTGISSPLAAQKFVTGSGRFDVARNSAAGMPSGPKGSAGNLAKVAKVVAALRAVKTGAGA